MASKGSFFGHSSNERFLDKREEPRESSKKPEMPSRIRREPLMRDGRGVGNL